MGSANSRWERPLELGLALRFCSDGRCFSPGGFLGCAPRGFLPSGAPRGLGSSPQRSRLGVLPRGLLRRSLTGRFLCCGAARGLLRCSFARSLLGRSLAGSLRRRPLRGFLGLDPRGLVCLGLARSLFRCQLLAPLRLFGVDGVALGESLPLVGKPLHQDLRFASPVHSSGGVSPTQTARVFPGTSCSAYADERT